MTEQIKSNLKKVCTCWVSDDYCERHDSLDELLTEDEALRLSKALSEVELD